MAISYSALLPEIILSLAGILILLAVPFTSGQKQARLGYLAFLAVLSALVAAAAAEAEQGLTFFNMVFQDRFSQFCKVLFLFAAGAITLSSISYLEREEVRHGEFFSLLLFATTGMCLMTASADLILTFLGLEILAVSTYVLVGFKYREVKSTESALKYFLLGAFSTAFLLYGIAFTYGTAGSTNYMKIIQVVTEKSWPLGTAWQVSGYPLTLALGLGLMLVGFGFKAAITPFHVWTPDVYEGAPLPITTHLAVGSKAAAVLALVRILYQVLPELSGAWQIILWVSAVLTMVIGNAAALIQTNIKRMLAYSSIAHAGYLLVGMTANNGLGIQGVLFYLLVYAIMNLGAFTVVQVLSRYQEQRVNISDYGGIGYRYPFLGFSLSVFLISLAGIPVTAGFMGKLFLFGAALQSQLYVLVVIALLASAVGVYYYLRVIVLMYMHESGNGDLVQVPLLAQIVIAIMMVGTFYLGILPGAFLRWANEAAWF